MRTPGTVVEAGAFDDPIAGRSTELAELARLESVLEGLNLEKLHFLWRRYCNRNDEIGGCFLGLSDGTDRHVRFASHHAVCSHTPLSCVRDVDCLFVLVARHLQLLSAHLWQNGRHVGRHDPSSIA
jgi:hypothetical protein